MSDKESTRSKPKNEKPDNSKPTILEKSLPVTPQDYIIPPKPPKQNKKEK